jgi:cation diffusion facilitator family transporter
MFHQHKHETQTHDHALRPGILGLVARIFHFGGHEHTSLAADSAFTGTNEGIRTVWLALLALGITSVLQIGIVAFSGSVALLADTVHNIGDTLNSIPLLIAFYLARRAATRRYTYGFGRAEDVSGIFIVLSIAVSAGIVFWESFQKLLNPQPMQNIIWVGAAAVIGFIGNEAVALLQIRTGRKIGSDAMIADGLHARIDGLTSLAVLIAVGGTAVGLLIGVAILFITRDAARRVWYRLMDAVDPGIVTQIEHYASEVKGVAAVNRVRVHWVGHQLFTELHVAVEASTTVEGTHRIIQAVGVVLRQAVPHLGETTIQIEAIETREVAKPFTLADFNILPSRYQLAVPNAAPMGAAGLKFDTEGKPAWNDIWTDFCDLALAGGPPHRGTLLEPVSPETVAANPDGYRYVLDELERGIRMVSALNVVQSVTPGWIGMVCTSEEMAVWLLRAIVVENVSVRREGPTLYFPASPTFRLESEIKNVITVIAKTHHYWQEHVSEAARD